MAFTDINFAFGAKLTSTQLNQLQGNFDAIAQGDSSEYNLFGQGIKVCYFYGLGAMHQFMSVGVSSVLYVSLGTYQINWTNSYTTENYCANFQMAKDGGEESYARASDPGDTDPFTAEAGVVMTWATDGI